MHLFRRFHDSNSGACSYLIGSENSRLAVFIDPVHDYIPLYNSVLEELGYRLACVFETHLHAEHLSATPTLRQLTNASLACGSESGIGDADIYLEDGDTLRFGDLLLTGIATPGHTPGCMSYLWEDRLFTGDSLLIGAWGQTNEPGGNPGQLYNSINQQLMGFPDEHLIYPGKSNGKGWVSCIGEERRSNPMFGGISRDEFITLCARQDAPLAPQAQDILAANRQSRQSKPLSL